LADLIFANSRPNHRFYMTFLFQKTQFGMLQIEFNKISRVKIFLVALFHTKHFRPQAARVWTFLTRLHSIFLLVFYYLGSLFSLRLTRFYGCTTFHFFFTSWKYKVAILSFAFAQKSTSPKQPFYDFLWTQAFIMIHVQAGLAVTGGALYAPVSTRVSGFSACRLRLTLFLFRDLSNRIGPVSCSWNLLGRFYGGRFLFSRKPPPDRSESLQMGPWPHEWLLVCPVSALPRGHRHTLASARRLRASYFVRY
jgi:hypothetical protein